MKKTSSLPLFGGGDPIIRILLYGTIVVVCLLTMLLFVSYAFARNHYVLPRLGIAGLVLLYLAVAFFLLKRRRLSTVAWMLVGFYGVLGFAILAVWGLNAPVGVLILGFTVLLTGIMLGSRYIIQTTFGLCFLILALQLTTHVGWIVPDTSRLDNESTFLDALSYSVIFTLFAMIAWIAGRRSEQLLAKSMQAEAALQKERDLLNVRLEEKTREVKEAQLEETRQLYRFAELGQLGTVLLHDLANNLTALTLDIDDIGTQLQRNESITRAKESIAYLETMVNGVRKQIHDRDKPVVFDAPKMILETIGALGPKARRAGVSIEYIPNNVHHFKVKGDPVRFTHILTILVSNGVEAYFGTKESIRSIQIGAQVVKGSLQIRITDHGRGVKVSERDNLFKPFSSSKPEGMGIGLFMAREMVERHFKGSLEFVSMSKDTTFLLTLPQA